MNQLARIDAEYRAARLVIYRVLVEAGASPNNAEAWAEAILASLAAHNPPILLQMEEVEPDEEYDGPVCSKCRMKPEEGFGYSLCGGQWLCDDCAAAQEREWDRKREER